MVKELEAFALRIKAAVLDDNTEPHEVWHLMMRLKEFQEKYGTEILSSYLDLQESKDLASKLFQNIRNHLDEEIAKTKN
jgi:hypothetical protein